MRRYKVTKTWVIETTFKLTKAEVLSEIDRYNPIEMKVEEV